MAKTPKINFHILTLFPKSFSALDESMIGRAREKGLVNLEKHDLRDWSLGKWKQVDDTPYGGGAGMLLMIEPLYNAWKKIKGRKKMHTILLSAKGKRYTQVDAERLAKMKNILLVCGHYEGVDERFTEHCVDEEISLGEFVLTGGELGAALIVDSVARLVDGVLGKNVSHEEESYSAKLDRKKEYPHYTKPAEFKGWKVPEVLLSGNHAKIEEWKKKNLG